MADEFLEKRNVEKQKEKFINSMGKEDIFVYEKQNIVKGFVIGSLNNEKYDCEILALYVAVEQQGKGIGKELLEHMKLFYKKKNAEL
ncbi:GNAT family N-acetyltransferase [Brucepastera parasyntrophica]|uniref:GNAT family N-acetyltransferase n=1 Tax=Brucepastera parasyntrophica TaxID=2880008 RepID=UPI00210BC7BC|nr:GNAT family N-acetyltransferase [Brucepastera parasyntrophica]